MYRIAGATSATSISTWPCTDGTQSCAGASAKMIGVVSVPVAGKTLYSGLASGIFSGASYLWLAETGKGAIRQIHLSSDCALTSLYVYLSLFIIT